ncbi:MAG: hypothetical protein JWO79_1270 [Actinomycetia bacterium]|nr:hypothetical protein [Actinomycetes bacterium]
MNFLQRLAAWMRAVRARVRGFETGALTVLPPPLIAPRTATVDLTSEADQRGVADARSSMQDSWSFGRPEDPLSDTFDPPYIHELRHRCQATLDTIAEYRKLTADRLEHVGRWRDESKAMMESARTMMSSIAVREARLEAETTRRSQAQDGVDESAQDPANANASLDELPWEGESVVLGWYWRALILAGLIVAEFSVQYYVYDLYLSGTARSSSTVTIALATAAIMVVGPYVAALLLRGQQATGAPRRIGLFMLALGVPWCYVVTVLGVLRGEFLSLGGSQAGSVSRQLHLTPVTVIIMFVALLLITGVMAFMLGLARRHPFQDAYVRHRTERNRLDVLRRVMVDQINPAYLEPGQPGKFGPDERAVRESYAAAEYAYFAALVRTVGDPIFTEAVQGRRGLRPPAPPSPAPEAAAEPAPTGGEPSPDGVTGGPETAAPENGESL